MKIKNTNNVVVMTTLSYTANLQTSSPSIQFDARVAGTITGVLTGAVTFYDGSTALKSVALSVQGTAIHSSNVMTYSSYDFRAVNSGDTNYSASSSTVLTPTTDFSVIPATSTINVVSGAPVNGLFALTAYFNYDAALSPLKPVQFLNLGR